jgi:hypothetical protein
MIGFRQFLLEFASPTSFEDSLKLALRSTGMDKVYLECKIPLKGTIDLDRLIDKIGASRSGGVKERNIMFYDTKDQSYRNNHQIVRTRDDGHDLEIVHKTRGDFENVMNDKSKITKFKVEAIANNDGTHHLSYMHTTEVNKLPSDIKAVTHKSIVEKNQDLKPIDFGHDIEAKQNVSMWYADGSPLIGEYAFQCKVDKHEAKHIQPAEDYYNHLVNKLSAYIETGMTKTEAVYKLTGKHI